MRDWWGELDGEGYLHLSRRVQWSAWGVVLLFFVLALVWG